MSIHRFINTSIHWYIDISIYRSIPRYTDIPDVAIYRCTDTLIYKHIDLSMYQSIVASLHRHITLIHRNTDSSLHLDTDTPIYRRLGCNEALIYRHMCIYIQIYIYIYRCIDISMSQCINVSVYRHNTSIHRYLKTLMHWQLHPYIDNDTSTTRHPYYIEALIGRHVNTSAHR